MKDLLKQFSGLIGAALAAACCLGFPAVLAALGAAGLGFIVHDAYLFPLFVGFVGFNLWLLWRSTRAHGQRAPFWLAALGGIASAAALWLMVTGIRPMPWLVYAGLAVLVVGSVWDFINGRRAQSCTEPVCASTAMTMPSNPARRVATGAAMSAGAAAAFYGMYKSVQAFTPTVVAGDIECWGINECKGTTACTTAFNSCTGQNECKGKGYIYVPAKVCAERGGQPLAGSPGDPAKG